MLSMAYGRSVAIPKIIPHPLCPLSEVLFTSRVGWVLPSVSHSQSFQACWKVLWVVGDILVWPNVPRGSKGLSYKLSGIRDEHLEQRASIDSLWIYSKVGLVIFKWLLILYYWSQATSRWVALWLDDPGGIWHPAMQLFNSLLMYRSL